MARRAPLTPCHSLLFTNSILRSLEYNDIVHISRIMVKYQCLCLLVMSSAVMKPPGSRRGDALKARTHVVAELISRLGNVGYCSWRRLLEFLRLSPTLITATSRLRAIDILISCSSETLSTLTTFYATDYDIFISRLSVYNIPNVLKPQTGYPTALLTFHTSTMVSGPSRSSTLSTESIRPTNSTCN